MTKAPTPQEPTASNISPVIDILLADDDHADCLLFKDALEELPLKTSLTIVYNGEELIDVLTQRENNFPNVLFLDLNMPRKNGFASLGLIKRSNLLQKLPVVIFTTTSDVETIKKVYRDAAHYYITKPSDFLQLKKVIYEALILVTNKKLTLSTEDKFIITGDSIIIPTS